MLKRPIKLDAAQVLGGVGGAGGSVLAGVKRLLASAPSAPVASPMPTLLHTAGNPAPAGQIEAGQAPTAQNGAGIKTA